MSVVVSKAVAKALVEAGDLGDDDATLAPLRFDRLVSAAAQLRCATRGCVRVGSSF
jgi:hypothetical protein